MARLADGPTVEVSTEVGAPPEVVWEMVTDINLPARFQDEFVGAEWIDDDGPKLGAAFTGRNHRGTWDWETTSYIVSYEPLRSFGWAVSDRDNPGSTWTYELSPSSAGTTLTYRRRLLPGPSGITSAIERSPEREEEIIASRNDEQRRNMQAVVDGIKALAEERPPPG